MKILRCFLKILMSLHLVLVIAACSNDVDYKPPVSSSEMAITHYSFGKMVIDGKNYDSDLSVSPQGAIKNWSFDYNSHLIEARNFKNLISGDVKTLILGIGYNSAASLSSDALAFIEKIKSKGIEVKILSTGKAVKLFNASAKKGLLAIFHLNC